MMPFVSWYTSCLRTQWPSGRLYSYFGNWGNAGVSCIEAICAKRRYVIFTNFTHHAGVLVGLSFSVNLNCRINFQCRRKNVIMVVYGKSDCGPCPDSVTVRVFLKSQVVILQTAQTWANAGVCGGQCACAVGGTFD